MIKGLVDLESKGSKNHFAWKADDVWTCCSERFRGLFLLCWSRSPVFHAAGQQASSHFKIDAAGISLSGITRSHRNKADMIHTIHTIHTLLSEPLEWPQMYSCCLLWEVQSMLSTVVRMGGRYTVRGGGGWLTWNLRISPNAGRDNGSEANVGERRSYADPLVSLSSVYDQNHGSLRITLEKLFGTWNTVTTFNPTCLSLVQLACLTVEMGRWLSEGP